LKYEANKVIAACCSDYHPSESGLY